MSFCFLQQFKDSDKEISVRFSEDRDGENFGLLWFRETELILGRVKILEEFPPIDLCTIAIAFNFSVCL